MRGKRTSIALRPSSFARTTDLKLLSASTVVCPIRCAGIRLLTKMKAFLWGQRSLDKILGNHCLSSRSMSDRITAGSNLFVKLRQLSVAAGEEYAIDNSVDIENIYIAVSDPPGSRIDGTIRANGKANIFLLSPGGVTVGTQAKLQIGGSFVGSTASGIEFADGTTWKFVEKAPFEGSDRPLTKLQIDDNSGAIEVQGDGNDLFLEFIPFEPIDRGNTDGGLHVNSGQTIALLGSEVSLKGGLLVAEGGRIELASVQIGEVSLNASESEFLFDCSAIAQFGNIELNQRALADVSGNESGAIQLWANNLNIADGANVLIQHQGTEIGGNIVVNVAETLDIGGASTDMRINSAITNQTVGEGRGGDIEVRAKRIVLHAGGGIDSNSFSSARGGDVAIVASESLELFGAHPQDLLMPSSVFASSFAEGDAGNITVETGHLYLYKASGVLSYCARLGNAGEVVVNATESVSKAKPIS